MNFKIEFKQDNFQFSESFLAKSLTTTEATKAIVVSFVKAFTVQKRLVTSSKRAKLNKEFTLNIFLSEGGLEEKVTTEFSVKLSLPKTEDQLNTLCNKLLLAIEASLIDTTSYLQDTWESTQKELLSLASFTDSKQLFVNREGTLII